MTCRELVEFLNHYLDGSLSSEPRTALDHHLSTCQECRAYLKSYQATIQLGQATFCGAGNKIPDEVPEELVQAVLKARRTPE